MRKFLLSVFIGSIFVFGSFFVWLQFQYEVPILMYHSLDRNSVGTYAAVSLEAFARQMDYIKRKGYKVISLEEYCIILRDKKPIPRGVVVITFDDGYKDNMGGIKLLKELKFPATIFVIANKIGEDKYLSYEEINWFLNNSKVTIGSHTLTECYLPEVDEEQVKKEVIDSKIVLEEMFNRSVIAIAYHSGGFDQRVLKYVEQAGYLGACTTNRGFSNKLELYQLRRIKINDSDNDAVMWYKLSGFYRTSKSVKNPF